MTDNFLLFYFLLFLCLTFLFLTLLVPKVNEGNFDKLSFSRYRSAENLSDFDCEWRLFILCKLIPVTATAPFSFGQRKIICFCSQKWKVVVKIKWRYLIVQNRYTPTAKSDMSQKENSKLDRYWLNLLCRILLSWS